MVHGPCRIVVCVYLKRYCEERKKQKKEQERGEITFHSLPLSQGVMNSAKMPALCVENESEGEKRSVSSSNLMSSDDQKKRGFSYSGLLRTRHS